MTPVTARVLLGQIRKLGKGGPHNVESDGDWLQRFADHRDELAFADLVRRHGPMVLGVARRVLHNRNAAEDVFQATFVVLANDAKSIRNRESVGSWLYGVAYRLANKAKSDLARRRTIERQPRERKYPDPVAEAGWRECLAILDEELVRLPERLRIPLVMCYLEGQTRDEAARHVGWSLRTFDRRLGRGRELLGARLSRRGVTLGAALVTALLGKQTAPAAVPISLADAAIKVGLAHAAGSAAMPIPSSIAALIEGIGKTAVWNKAGFAAVCIMGMTLAGAAGYGLANSGRQAEPKPEQGFSEPEAESRKPNADLHCDSLPDGAVMRLGTLQRRAIGAKLAMSTDGKSIIGVRGGKYIYVWDADTGKLREKRELAVDEHWWRFWLSDDGRWLAMDRDNGVAIWDLRTGQRTLQLPMKGQGFVDRVVFSADYKIVGAVFHADGQTRHLIHAWNLADGKELLVKELRVTSGGSVLAFSPDGKRLFAAISSTERGMHCWDIATGGELWTEKEFVPQTMIFTPDGKILSTHDKYRVVDPATGKPLPNNKVPALTWEMLPKLTPDGRTLLVSTNDDIIVWDLIEGKEIRTLKPAGKPNRRLTQLGGQFLVAPDGKSIVTNNGVLQRWDLATGQRLWEDNFEAGHVEEVAALASSANAKRLASASADGTVRLWDLSTGKAIHVWRGHEWRRHNLDWRMEKAGVTALDMTPDGRWVLSAGSEGKIQLHDAATGKQLQTVALPAPVRGEGELRVFHLRITPDGSKAVVLFGAEGFYFTTGPGGIDPPFAKHTYKLATWDLKTGALVDKRAVEVLPVRSSAISPDGRTLLAGSVLTDVRTGKEIAKLEGAILGGSNEPAVFSPDGALIVGVFTEETKKDGSTIHSPGGVRVWEAATGKTVAHLKTKSWVGQVAIHPDNRYVITNDYDGVQAWDAITRKVVAVRPMHERVHSSTTSGSFASCLAFTPAGRLATGHPDGTVLLWDVPLPPLPPQALTAKELETLWSDLAAADAAKAWRIIWRLSDASAVPLVRERLKPILPVPAEKMQGLVANLDAESFERRQEVVKQLKALGLRAAPALREALEGSPTAEMKRRIQEVLAALETPGPFSDDAVRELRTVIVLERMGTRGARETLAALATGVPDARLTREAKAALARLTRR
jgi:RNA polymerase sigma factor (sigma-70 family)